MKVHFHPNGSAVSHTHNIHHYIIDSGGFLLLYDDYNRLIGRFPPSTTFILEYEGAPQIPQSQAVPGVIAQDCVNPVQHVEAIQPESVQSGAEVREEEEVEVTTVMPPVSNNTPAPPRRRRSGASVASAAGTHAVLMATLAMVTATIASDSKILPDVTGWARNFTGRVSSGSFAVRSESWERAKKSSRITTDALVRRLGAYVD